MHYGYDGKVAVVTGGSSGIGLASLRILLDSGAKVAFCARTESRLKQAEAELARDYGEERVLAKPLSVLDKTAVAGFADEVRERFKRCDLLVNNAGQGRVSTFAETDDAAWREEFELKLFSQIHPIRSFLPMLRKTRGSIVIVNSMLAYQPEPHMVCTAAARAGVQNLARSLSIEFAPEVRVNSILLGVVDSGQWSARFETRDDKTQSRDDWYRQQAESRGVRLGRLGEPAEAASAIAFLGSPGASYITGAQIEVSGGLSRHI